MRTAVPTPIFVAIIEHEKAFGSVETSVVMQALRNQGVEEPYAEIREPICNGCRAIVVLHNESNKIPKRKGIRQGGTTSPMLFIVCLQEVFRYLDLEQLGIRVNVEGFNLRFSDDIALLSNPEDERQSKINDLGKS